MESSKSLTEVSKSISNKLLESIRLIEILQELIDGEAKEDTILSIISKNIISSFNEIEYCRTLTGLVD